VYTTYPKTQTIAVGVTEGERFEETYTSTGRISQRITLKKTGVVNSSVTVLVSEGPNSQDVLYTFAERLISGTSSSRVFTIETSADGQATVVFGNGINGRIPTTNAPIKITYRRSRGTAGNVLVGAIKALESTTVLNKPSLNGLVVLPNTVRAAGGFDSESIVSMRANIPVSFRTQDRAVSLQDYRDIVKRVAGVVKSTAYMNGNTVEIRAVEPQADYGSSETLVLLSDTVTAIQDYLEPREIVFATSNVGASVSLTRVNFAANVNVKDGYVREDVKDKVDTAVREVFSFDAMDFGASVSLGTLYRTILDIDGVDYAVITKLTTTGGNVIDDTNGFKGVIAPSTSMLVISTSSSYTLTMSGGITAVGG
jgi:predicted phage baseplate assembly protein